MKKLLLLALVIYLLPSCKKCRDCTQTITTVVNGVKQSSVTNVELCGYVKPNKSTTTTTSTGTCTIEINCK